MKKYFILSILIVTGLFSQTNLKRYQADQLFDKGLPFPALEIYKGLMDENPNDPELNYNVGNALYRLQRYDQAMAFYQRALENTKDEKLKSNILYNLANCQYQQKKYKESVDGYKSVLRGNPEDMDARKNLELALKEIKKQEPPPPKNNDDKKNKDPKNDKKENKDKKKDQDSSQDKDQDKEKSDPKNSRPKEGDMSKKLAERILDAFKNQEKNYQQKKMKEKVTGEEKTEKDW